MVPQTVQRETFKLFRTVLSRKRGRTGGGSEVTGLCDAHSLYASMLSHASICAGCGSSSLHSPSAAHEELLTHPFQIFRGRWCLPGGLCNVLEPCDFLPLHLEILLAKSQLRSKPSLAELHCHKTSKPTPAQLFSDASTQPTEKSQSKEGWF